MKEEASSRSGSWRLRRPDLRDLRWAAIVGTLLGVSPMTGSGRVWLSALLGLAAGVFVLGMRVAGAPRPRRDPTVGRPPLATALALLGVALAFFPALTWLFEASTVSVWRHAHGVMVPLFMFLLGRSVLRRDPNPGVEEHSAWGLALVAVGLVLAVLDAGAGTHYLAVIGLMIAIPGLSLLWLGGRRTRALAGVLALPIFLIPVPQFSADPLALTEGSAALAEPLVRAGGVPAIRRETYFVLRDGVVGVSQNCSGLSTAYAAFALAFALALPARSWRRGLAPLLVAYPVTLALNTLRLTGILWASHQLGFAFLETALHGFSGLVVLWATLGIVWLASDRVAVREALS